MKILIDGHMLGKNEGGNERYIKDMSIALIKSIGGENKIKIAVSREYYSKQNDFSPENLIILPFENDFFRLLFFEIICYIYNFNILHSTYVSPFFIPKTASIITVHDLSFKKHPQFYSLRENLIFRYLLPLSLKRAEVIIVPSKFTKKELVRYFSDYKNKTYVIYEGPNECFFPIEKQKAKKIVEEKYGITSPFILTINSKNKKKNTNHVLKTFKKNKIVVVGPKTNIDIKLQKNAVFLQNVTDYDLNYLFNACEFFVSLSLYEGFNLPIMEAIKTRVPVIASDIPIHRELYGNFVVYNHEKSIQTAKVARILLNKYSWNKSAKKLLEIYKKAARQ